MKTIEIDYEKLTEYLVHGCSFLALSNEGTLYCQKKMDATCRLPLYERDNCPRDCPHMNETISWRCDAEKCREIKKTIKQLKAQ